LIGTDLELAGIDIIVALDFDFTYAELITFLAKRTALETQYADRDATTGRLSLKTTVTFPYADIGLTSATIPVERMLIDLADYQLYESWYCGYTKFNKAARELTFSITPTEAALYTIST